MQKNNTKNSTSILKALKESGKLKKPQIPLDRSFKYKC